MLFNAIAFIAAAASTVAAAPYILYPRVSTIWQQGLAHNITWQPVTGTGNFALVHDGSSQTLANNVDLSSGRTVVNVPTTNGGDGYTIVLTANDGTTSTSGSFNIGRPDTPGSTGAATGTTSPAGTGSVTTTTSTSTTTASASSGAGGSASSAASSVASSASSAAASISSSLSSAISSASAAASSGASSISAHASSAMSSATAPSGSGASSTSSSSAALGATSFADIKFGAAVTAGLLVISTIGGLTIF